LLEKLCNRLPFETKECVDCGTRVQATELGS